MELNREEVWHIYFVLRERGVSHCEVCKELFEKFEKEKAKLFADSSGGEQ